MAGLNSASGQQPWPTRHRCDDGRVRSLRTYDHDEWSSHPDTVAGVNGFPPGDPHGGMAVLNRHRIAASRSLGRDPMVILSAMARRGRRNG
jgi:hypothetical protein